MSNEKTQVASAAIEPLFNEAFIRIFGKEQSKGVTRSLVNAVLEKVGVEPIGDIERIAAEHTSVEGSVECKAPRFDVQLVSGSRYVDLEAQLYPTEVGNRSVYYAASTFVSATEKARTYSDLPQAVVITLLDDPPLFPDSSAYVHVCRWNWEVDGSYVAATDRQIVVLVELAKIREVYNGLSDEVLSDKMLSWAYLVTKGYREGAEMDQIIDSYPDIEEFAELYGLAINDPKVVNAYRDAKSAVMEYNNRLEYYAKLEREARERGEREGWERGEREGWERGEREGREYGEREGRREGREEGIKEGREEGREEGIKEGIKEGREEGREEATLDHLRNLMASTGCDVDEAMTLLGIHEASRPALKDRLLS